MSVKYFADPALLGHRAQPAVPVRHESDVVDAGRIRVLLFPGQVLAALTGCAGGERISPIETFARLDLQVDLLLVFQAALKHHACRAVDRAEYFLGLGFVVHRRDRLQFTQLIQLHLMLRRPIVKIVLREIIRVVSPLVNFLIIVELHRLLQLVDPDQGLLFFDLLLRSPVELPFPILVELLEVAERVQV